MKADTTTASAWQPEAWFGLSGWWRQGAIAIIAALIGAFTLLTYVMGGTATVYPYFILIPILLSAGLFGYRGGLLCGLAAGLAMGPLMPMDVVAGTAQSQTNWLTRVGIYILLGGFAGVLFSRLHGHSRQLLTQAYSDSISGLPNRKSLEKRVTDLLTAHPSADGMENQPSRVFVISIQLQNYRSTISALGFTAERPLLQDMSARLKRIMAPRSAQVYHVNDEHFAMLLVDHSRQECLLATQEAVAALQEPFSVHGIPVYLGAHAGVSSFPFHERENPGRLLTKAWLAMYEAGEAGRNYSSYKKQTESNLRTVKLLGELQAAIEEEQLILHYQPKVDIRDGRLIGVEALVRWQHPTQGLIPPAHFIPQAERTGLIHPLTRWVAHNALRETSTLILNGGRVPCSINVSARNFLDPDFVDELLEMVTEADVKAGELELELTETAVMIDPEAVIMHLVRLGKAGLSLSIDDFGTGHSSLAYLKRLPVSVLKIDQTFVRNLQRNSADTQIIRASISLAHNLGMTTVAEGVEDTATLRLLANMGCDAAQGYGIAKPMPATDLLEWATRSPVRLPGNASR